MQSTRNTQYIVFIGSYDTPSCLSNLFVVQSLRRAAPFHLDVRTSTFRPSIVTRHNVSRARYTADAEQESARNRATKRAQHALSNSSLKCTIATVSPSSQMAASSERSISTGKSLDPPLSSWKGLSRDMGEHLGSRSGNVAKRSPFHFFRSVLRGSV